MENKAFEELSIKSKDMGSKKNKKKEATTAAEHLLDHFARIFSVLARVPFHKKVLEFPSYRGGGRGSEREILAHEEEIPDANCVFFPLQTVSTQSLCWGGASRKRKVVKDTVLMEREEEKRDHFTTFVTDICWC